MKTIYLRTLSLLALALAAIPAHAQYGFTSVANTGTLANATVFSSANRTYINNNGDIVYTATVSGNRTILKSIAGANIVVAAQGAATAYGSTYTGTIDGLSVTLNDSGQVTFRGDAAIAGTVTTANNVAIVRDTTPTATIVSREGTTAVAGSTPNVYGNFSVNNAGTTVYTSTLNSGGSGLFSVSATQPTGTATRLLAPGDSATGVTGGTFNVFSFPSIASTGDVSFQSTITNGGTATAGLFNLSAGGAVSKIAAVGDTDTGGVNTYTSFAGIVRGDSGTFFTSAVANGNTGVYLGSGNALTTLVAQEGQTILGATYGGAFSLGNINAAGVGVFRATSMTGAFTSAIFTFNSTGQVSKVLTNADPLFGSNATSLGIPTINNAGQVAFTYTLANATQGVLVGTVVPEAGTVSLLFVGLTALGTIVLRRRK